MRTVLSTLVVATCLVAQDPVPSRGRLALSVTLDADAVDSGAPVSARAVFRNAGKAAVSFFVPEHARLLHFPGWRLRAVGRGAGGELEPAAVPFSSEFRQGLQGEVVTLAAGESRSFPVSMSGFAPAGTAPSARDAQRLAAGTYELRCRYERGSDRLPHGFRGFQTKERRYPGLWVGRIESPPVRLMVRTPTVPVLRLAAPRIARVGEPYPLKITLRNPTSRSLEGPVTCALSVSCKARGSAAVRFGVDPETGAVRDEPPALRIPPGGERKWTIDAARLSLVAKGPAAGHRLGLFALARGTFFLRLTVRVGADSRSAASASLMRSVAPLEPAAAPLALDVAPAADGDGHVIVTLRNRGRESVRVARPMTYPSVLSFALSHPASGLPRSTRVALVSSLIRTLGDGPGPRAVVSAPFAWDAARFEDLVELNAGDFVLLRPGKSLQRSLDVSALVRGGLPPGRYVVKALWRSFEAGRRFGFGAAPAAVGHLSSSPLEFRVR